MNQLDAVRLPIRLKNCLDLFKRGEGTTQPYNGRNAERCLLGRIAWSRAYDWIPPAASYGPYEAPLPIEAFAQHFDVPRVVMECIYFESTAYALDLEGSLAMARDTFRLAVVAYGDHLHYAQNTATSALDLAFQNLFRCFIEIPPKPAPHRSLAQASVENS